MCEKRAWRRRRRVCVREEYKASSSSSHLLHRIHTCSINGVCVRKLTRDQRGREKEPLQACNYEYGPLESRHRMLIKRWVTHFAPFFSFRGDPALCVCVGGWNTTHVRSHSQESPKLFFSRVSAGEGDDGRRREVKLFPASSLLHKERWVGNSSTMRSQEGHSLRPILSVLRNGNFVFCVYQINMLKNIALIWMAKKQVLRRARRRLCTSYNALL